MVRPKTGKKRQNMMLTVTPQTRTELAFISEHYSESISALVSEWAAKEAKSIEKQTGKVVPLAGQISMDDLGQLEAERKNGGIG